MKKIVLASGVLALGLLASCSNDAPVVNPDNSNLDGDYRYIAIRVAPNSETRAGTSGSEEAGDANERSIDSATLYLVDATDATKVTVARNLNVNFNGSGDATVINFPVPADAFKDLTAKAGTNAEYKLYIVANAEKNNFVMNTFDLHAVVEKSSWGEGDNKGRAGYFYMSNDDEIKVKLPSYSATGANNGSSAANAWVINTGSEVVLNRLAARFDLKVDADAYTAPVEGQDDDATFTITGAGLQHINNKSYLFRHMSTTGKSDAATADVFGREGHLVTPKADWYGTTGKVGNLVYETNLIPYQGEDPAKFNYGFENAVDGAVTTGMSEADINKLISYKNLTYMAFCAKFTYPGWTDQRKSFAVYNGEIVGTLEQMKSTDFMPKMSDANRPYVVNTLNTLRGTDGSGITVAALRAAGFDYFTPAEDGTYTCYYVTPLFNDVTEGASGCCYYRVRRNRLYNMDLESISMIGHDAEYQPDVVKVDEAKWLGLNVTVKKWTINNNSFQF